MTKKSAIGPSLKSRKRKKAQKHVPNFGKKGVMCLYCPFQRVDDAKKKFYKNKTPK